MAREARLSIASVSKINIASLPKKYGPAKYDHGHTLSSTAILCGGVMLIIAFADYADTRPMSESLQYGVVFGLIFVIGGIVGWRASPWNRPEIIVDAAQITLACPKGTPLVPKQTHDWHDIQRFQITYDRKHPLLMIELSTGRLGYGKKVQIDIGSLEAEPKVLADTLIEAVSASGRSLQEEPRRITLGANIRSWLVGQ